MTARSSPRRRRLWPLLLLLPALIALLELAVRDARAPKTTSPQDDLEAGSAATTPIEPRARPVRPRPRSQDPGPPDDAPRADDPQPVARRIDPCGGVSAYGTCAGDVARACLGGRVLAVDCAARGERCVMTREGASCLPRRGRGLDCSAGDPAVCEGDVLRHCVDGAWERIDCAMRGSRCETTRGTARCAAAAAADGALAAAAAANGRAAETCDGEDQDGDEAIDEGGACDEIALVAFVPQGADLRELPARMQHELAIANRVFYPLTFTWRTTVETDLAGPTFHPRMFNTLARALSREPRAYAAAPPADDGARSGEPSAQAEPATATPAAVEPPFYIPVLYVEEIGTSPPKAGMSTLPNARCGGVRISDAPAPVEGLIVVSEVRQPETLAHELGHYLGLCHTHEELEPYGLAGAPAAVCEGTGDGVCDTPFDPGPPQCTELYTCAPQCEGIAAAPDTSNVMSYYMRCRERLSAQQLAEAERNLALRRGWFPCLDPGDCPCMPGDPAGCPAEMSCQPAQRIDAPGECVLDGPALPGAPCSHLGNCSAGAICLGARGDATHSPRCARACLRDTDGCTCTDVGLAFGVCRQDLS